MVGFPSKSRMNRGKSHVGPERAAHRQDSVLLSNMEHRLERGEIITFTPCPFLLPQGDDRAFLLQQRLHSSIHKNISYNPANDVLSGYIEHSREQGRRFGQLLQDFSRRVCAWLTTYLPRYAQTWPGTAPACEPKRKPRADAHDGTQ